MTEPRLDRRSTDARLGLLERDMAELLPLVRSQQAVINEMNGVMKALRIASLLVGIAVSLFTLVQVVQG